MECLAQLHVFFKATINECLLNVSKRVQVSAKLRAFTKICNFSKGTSTRKKTFRKPRHVPRGDDTICVSKLHLPSHIDKLDICGQAKRTGFTLAQVPGMLKYLLHQGMHRVNKGQAPVTTACARKGG